MADNIPQFRRKTSDGYQILQEGNPFQVPDNKLQENITVTPSNERQVLHATPPYNGIHEIIVKSVSESDSALNKENIREGITIFGITGEYGGGGGSDLYAGDVNLTTNPQTFNPEGHDGFSSIKVTANISSQGTTSSPYVIPVNNSKDQNYVTIPKPSSSIGMSQAVVKLHSDLEQYIKKDIKILGITGIYEGGTPSLGNLDVTPSTVQQEHIASSDGYDGYSRVTVNAIQTETKSAATPGTSSQTITPSTGKFLAKVTVPAVSTETKSDNAKANEDVVINRSSGKFMTKFTINKVQAIENGATKNIESNMIKTGVTILGIEGSYFSPEGSGGLNYTENIFSNYTTVDINTTVGGYGYTDEASIADSGGTIREFTNNDRGTGSLIICTIGSNINRITGTFGSETVSGVIVDSVGYLNIPYPYSGTVVVKAYFGTTIISSTSLNINSLGYYTCTL